MADSYHDFVFYFIFMALVIGAICREIKKWLNIPYTPMLLVIGIAWGLLEEWFGYTGRAADFVEQIEPVKLTQHGILMCVIPAIAFDSGINTDWHTLKKDFGQVLLLAGPGIVIIAILVAIIFRYPLGYDQLSWSEALMIGSILSATDPVAVIAMLKEVGASNKISVIIDGESLLNDGTAMVFFHVMAEIVKQGSFNVGDVIGLFFRLTLGAWTCGYLFAIVMYFWFRRLANDSVEATGLTLFAAYLLFLLCEGTEVVMSGILAICSLGYFLSGFSGNVISPLVEEPLHQVWAFVGWVAETELFVLAGVIIGGHVIPDDQIEGKDWPLLILHFVLLYLTRVVMIGMFYPILKYSGYSINWRSFIIFVHAGLRGGVGLALSLTVWADSEFSDAVRNIVVFHVSGMAVMTVILNGCTGKWILQSLGLSDNSGEQELAINDATKTVIEAGDHAMAKLMGNLNLGEADWSKVLERTGIRDMAQGIVSKLTAGRQVVKDLKKEGRPEALMQNYEEKLSLVEDSKRLAEARSRFLLVLKKRYAYFREKGLCLPNSYVYLIHQVDLANDSTETKLNTWDVCQSTVLSVISMRLLLKLRCVPLIKKVVFRQAYRQIGEAYDRCVVFNTAHEEAWKIFSKTLPGLTSQIRDKLSQEIQEQIFGCKTYMSRYILEGYKRIVAVFQERTAAMLILNKIQDTIGEDTEKGVITAQEAALLSEPVEGHLWSMFYKSPMKGYADMLSCVSSWPLFNEVSKEFISELNRISSTVLFLNAEKLYHEGDALKWAYIVVHGRVTEKHFNGAEFQHTPGCIVGAQYALSQSQSVSSTANADMWVFARRIHIADMQVLVSKYEKDIWRIAYPVLIMFSQGVSNGTPEQSSKALVRMVSVSKITMSNPGEIVYMPYGGAAIPEIPEVPEGAENGILRQDSDRKVVLIEPQDPEKGMPISRKAAVIHFEPELYDRWVNSGRDMNKMLNNLSEPPLDTEEKTNLGHRATAMSGGEHDSDEEFLSPGK